MAGVDEKLDPVDQSTTDRKRYPIDPSTLLITSALVKEVEASGKVHISYRDVINGDLKYALRSGGVWGPPDVIDSATGANLGFGTSLELDV